MIFVKFIYLAYALIMGFYSIHDFRMSVLRGKDAMAMLFAASFVWLVFVVVPLLAFKLIWWLLS